MPLHHRLPLAVGLPLAVAAGVCMPIQGRINGALGARLDDGLAAAVVSFSTGLVLLAALCLLLPAARRGLRRVVPALRERKFPRWYLLAGCSGAFLVLSQAETVALIGIALFTVAAVTGQTVSGLLVDRLGWGPGGRSPVTGIRVISAVLTVLAVAWAVSPKLILGGPTGAWLLPVLLPLAAGFLQSFQQALNGVQTMHYRSPWPATLINFVVGGALLWAAWGIKVAIAGVGNPLPAEWWCCLGGPIGCAFIALARGAGPCAGRAADRPGHDLRADPGLAAAGPGGAGAGHRDYDGDGAGYAADPPGRVLGTLPWQRHPFRNR